MQLKKNIKVGNRFKFFHNFMDSLTLKIYIILPRCLIYNYTLVNCVDLKLYEHKIYLNNESFNLYTYSNFSLI